MYGKIDVRSIPVIDSSLNDGLHSVSKKRPRLQYTPASSFFQHHQTELRKRAHDSTAAPLTATEELIIGMKWAEAKLNPEIRGIYDQKSVEEVNEMKMKSSIAHIAGVQPGVYRLKEDEDDCFFVNLAIAEVEGQFRMRLSADGKESLTRIKVVSQRLYLGREVTEVRLFPQTGRRHQLRLHLTAIGHPIVGDETYADSSFSPELPPRMMLHAHDLLLPFDDGKRLHVTSPIPFP